VVYPCPQLNSAAFRVCFRYSDGAQHFFFLSWALGNKGQFSPQPGRGPIRPKENRILVLRTPAFLFRSEKKGKRFLIIGSSKQLARKFLPKTIFGAFACRGTRIKGPGQVGFFNFPLFPQSGEIFLFLVGGGGQKRPVFFPGRWGRSFTPRMPLPLSNLRGLGKTYIKKAWGSTEKKTACGPPFFSNGYFG